MKLPPKWMEGDNFEPRMHAKGHKTFESSFPNSDAYLGITYVIGRWKLRHSRWQIASIIHDYQKH